MQKHSQHYVRDGTEIFSNILTLGHAHFAPRIFVNIIGQLIKASRLWRSGEVAVLGRKSIVDRSVIPTVRDKRSLINTSIYNSRRLENIAEENTKKIEYPPLL